MEKDQIEVIEKKLDTVVRLLQHLVALELARGGVTTRVIGKHLHVATAKVVNMLSGVKREA